MSEKVMEQGTIKAIGIVLDLLRDCLVVNGVSLGYDKQNNELIFFDTGIYLQEKRFSGFTVPIEKLVR